MLKVRYDTQGSSHRHSDGRPKDDDLPPQEIPISKRPVQIRPAIKPTAFRPRDPRYDRRCGEFSNRIFSTTYSFVDDIKKKELNELEQMLRRETDKGRKSQIKSVITRLKNQQVTENEKKLKEERLDRLKREKRAILYPNSGPHSSGDSQERHRKTRRVFLSKTEVKKMDMVDKFKELKSTGKLTKYLERKRKKLINRDGKGMPT